MRTRRTRARLSLRLRFRGGMPRRAMTTWAGITWFGRETWCSLRRHCWLAVGPRRRGGRWCTWLVRSGRMGVSRRTSGSTGRLTGPGFNWTRWRFRSSWRGGLWKLDGLGVFDVFPFVEQAAAFLVRYAPVTQQERWEENAGYSPSTLAAVISGLVVCGGYCAGLQGERAGAGFWRRMRTGSRSHLDEWTTTEDGVLLDGVKRHYMRIRPPAEGEPFHNPELAPGFIRLANRGAGERRSEFDAREVMDGGFLELVRYGIRRADDPLMVESLEGGG